MERFHFINKNKISQLPEATGVYAFSKKAELLYIGKATNLRERVKNHFNQPNYRDNLFIDQTDKIGFIRTNSEFAEPSAHLTSHPASQGSTIEALLLEARLIKKYQPKYNIVWKDGKNYFYVAITKEDFPRVFITHRAPVHNSKLIGPFIEGRSLKRALDCLRRVFPYYASKKHPQKNCLWCQLKLCPGPSPDKKSYRKNIKELITVLQGKSRLVWSNFKKEMEKAAASQNFEKAAKIRDQIESLEKVILHSRVFEPTETKLQEEWNFKRIEAYDISNIQGKTAVGSMIVFTRGLPDKSQYRKFKIKMKNEPNDTGMIKEVLLRRFGHPEWPYPDLILIDGGKAQLNIAIKSKLQNPKSKKIKVMAIAKKKNELYIEGKKEPVLLKSLPREVFNIILRLRDEAHRFAIAFHHKLRTKALLED